MTTSRNLASLSGVKYPCRSKKSTSTCANSYRQSVIPPRRGEFKSYHRTIGFELSLDHPLHDLFQLHQHETLDLTICRIRPRYDGPIRGQLEVIDVLHLRLDPSSARSVSVGDEGDAADGGFDKGGREGGFFGAFANDGFEGKVASCDSSCDRVVEE